MDDITPLNLEDSPKLFGLRYDQLIAILGSLVLSTQLYSWMMPINLAGQDIKLWIYLFFGLVGPFYCLVTLNHSASYWETLLNFYTGSKVLIPGPDPNTTRFLVDEKLPDFVE